MRNLKKILALVLALVMTMSLVTVASAATEDISANYAEAVEVLQDMGVFQGYEDGTFGGKNFITREEVATVLYRIISEDLDDSHKGLYVEACDFNDVAATRWSAGFIGYCANGGYVKGYSDDEFGPADKVTGYQVLAMILRAVGYDKNDEFTGSDWYKNVAATAQQLGILVNVSKDVVLSQPATRELVAELIFRTIATVEQVAYTPAFGYQPVVNTIDKTPTTLGWDNFKLKDEYPLFIDDFGRPGYVWVYDVDDDGYYTRIEGYEKTTIEDEALVTFNTPITECTLMSDSGLTAYYGKEITLPTYVNGQTNVVYPLYQAQDQVNYVGGQGRITEVYADRVVMVDTFLAYVAAVTPVVKDTAGHNIKDASMVLYVYDRENGYTAKTLTKTTDYTYTAGQYVLTHALTAAGTKNTEKATYEAVATVKNAYVLNVAESFTGKQSALHYFADKHTIDGTVYDDNCTYNLDKAGNQTYNFRWFKDQFGNIIGSAVVADTYTYGVINHIQWFTQATAAGYAQATLTLMDGTQKSVVVRKLADTDDAVVLGSIGTTLTRAYTTQGDIETKTVSTEWGQNDEYVGHDLYCIVDNGDGTVNLVAVESPAFDSLYTVMADADEVAGTVDIYPGQYNILGVAGKIVDSNTKFMVGSWNGYEQYFSTTTYAGFNSLPTLDDCTVDYVDLGKDGRVDYVYILGDVMVYNNSSLFYMTSNSHVQMLTENGVPVYAYVLTGYLDGKEGYIKIANDAEGAALVEYILNNWEANGKNAMFAVAYQGDTGLTVAADYVANSLNMTAYSYYGYRWSSNYLYGAVYAAKDSKGDVTRYEFTAGNGEYAIYNGDVLIIYNGDSTVKATYDVTDATRVIGVMDTAAVYGANYVIHVVSYTEYDENAFEIFVFEKPDPSLN